MNWRLAAILCLNLFYRWRLVLTRDFWGDEVTAVKYVREYSFFELTYIIPFKQPHMPLYYLLIDPIFETWGWALGTMRLVSVVFAVGAAYMAYRVTLAITDNEYAGLSAALLFSLSPWLAWWGANIRPYSLLSLVALVLLYTLIERSWRWMLATGATIAYLHPYGWAYLAIAIGVYGYEENRNALVAAIPVGYLMGILAVELKVTIQHLTPSWNHRFWLDFPYLWLFSSQTTLWQTWLIYLPYVTVPAALYKRADRRFLLALGFAVLPVFAAIAAHHVHPVLDERYLIGSAAAYICVLVSSLAILDERLLALVPVYVVGQLLNLNAAGVFYVG